MEIRPLASLASWKFLGSKYKLQKITTGLLHEAFWTLRPRGNFPRAPLGGSGYCCLIWGCCGKTKIDRLQKLQYRAPRIVTNSNYDAPSMHLIRSLGWETIDDLINQEIKTTTFISVNDLAPQYLIDFFTRN